MHGKDQKEDSAESKVQNVTMGETTSRGSALPLDRR